MTIYKNKMKFKEFWPDFSNEYNKKIHYIYIDDIIIKIKTLYTRVHCAYFSINGDHYKIIFGLGIDSNKRIWDKTKYKYFNKKVINDIEKIIKNKW